MANANDRAGIAAPQAQGRIMVSLSTTPACAAALHQVAAHQGLSLAQLLRLSVQQYVESQCADELPQQLEAIRSANKNARPRVSARYRHRSDYSQF